MTLKSSLELPNRACHLSDAREFARRLLDRSPAGPEEKDDALLIVGELCGNVVRHACLSAQESYRVEIEIAPGRARITVTDRGRGFDRDRVSLPAWDREGGRGLWLIESLSEDVQYGGAPDGGCSISATVRIRAGEAEPSPAEAYDPTASDSDLEDDETPAPYLFSGR